MNGDGSSFNAINSGSSRPLSGSFEHRQPSPQLEQSTEGEHIQDGNAGDVSQDEDAKGKEDEQYRDAMGRKHVQVGPHSDALYFINAHPKKLLTRFDDYPDEVESQLRVYIAQNVPKELHRDDYGSVIPIQKCGPNQLARLQAAIWRDIPLGQAATFAPLPEASMDDAHLVIVIFRIATKLDESPHVFAIRKIRKPRCDSPLCPANHGHNEREVVSLEPILSTDSYVDASCLDLFEGRILVFRPNEALYKHKGFTIQNVVSQYSMVFCFNCLQELWDERARMWAIMDKVFRARDARLPGENRQLNSSEDESDRDFTIFENEDLADDDPVEGLTPEVASWQGISSIYGNTVSKDDINSSAESNVELPPQYDGAGEHPSHRLVVVTASQEDKTCRTSHITNSLVAPAVQRLSPLRRTTTGITTWALPPPSPGSEDMSDTSNDMSHAGAPAIELASAIKASSSLLPAGQPGKEDGVCSDAAGYVEQATPKAASSVVPAGHPGNSCYAELPSLILLHPPSQAFLGFKRRVHRRAIQESAERAVPSKDTTTRRSSTLKPSPIKTVFPPGLSTSSRSTASSEPPTPTQAQRFPAHLIPPPVFCFCRKPDDGSKMLQCSNEDCLVSWYHYNCFTKSEKLSAASSKKWRCPVCANETLLRTQPPTSIADFRIPFSKEEVMTVLDGHAPFVGAADPYGLASVPPVASRIEVPEEKDEESVEWEYEEPSYEDYDEEDYLDED